MDMEWWDTKRYGSAFREKMIGLDKIKGNVVETGDVANSILRIVLLRVSATLAGCGVVYYGRKN